MPLPLPRPHVTRKPPSQRELPKSSPALKLVPAENNNAEHSGRMHVANDQDVEIPDLSMWHGR